jgi:phage terminase large subunit
LAESIPVLKRGAYKDFQDILISLNLYDEANHNKTDRTIKVGKSTFEFLVLMIQLNYVVHVVMFYL